MTRGEGPFQLSASVAQCVKSGLACVAVLAMLGGCTTHVTAPPAVVVAAPPPKDDGKASNLSPGGMSHSAALEELKLAPLFPMIDKQHTFRILIPDARHWTRVKFYGLPSLFGLRYGKEHHAVVGATIQHVDGDASLAECSKAFEAWGAPWLDAFDVDVARDPVVTVPWKGGEAEIHTSYAKAASLLVHDGFAVAYGAYPAWKGACLVVGIAVPAHDDEGRAKAARDRFARDVLPRVVVVGNEEPKGRY
jgi:hypothetical protein